MVIRADGAWPTPEPRIVAPRHGDQKGEMIERRQVSISIGIPGLGGSGTTTADSGGSENSGGTTTAAGGGTTSNGGSSGDTTTANGSGDGSSGNSGNDGSGSGGTTSQGSGSGGSGGSGSGGTTTQVTTSQGNQGGGVATATIVTSAAPVQTLTSSSTDARGSVVRVTVTSSNNVVTLTSSQAGTTGATANGDRSSTSSSNGGVIGGVVGGVVGGLALITLVTIIAILWRRRRSRTGHGWFLCFGRRPNRKHDDLDVDWPTFDPTSGAAGVGGTLGSAGASRGATSRQQGTLPNVGADDEDEFGVMGAPSTVGRYSRDEMRDLGSGPYTPSAGGYYSGHGGASNAESYQNDGANGYGSPQGIGGAAGTGAFAGQHHDHNESAATAPDYGHLDPPEVREQRAREQAESQANAMAAYNQRPSSPPHSPQQRQMQQRNNSTQYPFAANSSPPPPRSPPPQLSGSPPPYVSQGQTRRPSSRQAGAQPQQEQRFSSGGAAAAMFGNSSFWDDGAQDAHSSPMHQQAQLDDDAGTVIDGDYQGGARRLHLLNP